MKDENKNNAKLKGRFLETFSFRQESIGSLMPSAIQMDGLHDLCKKQSLVLLAEEYRKDTVTDFFSGASRLFSGSTLERIE